MNSVLEWVNKLKWRQSRGKHSADFLQGIRICDEVLRDKQIYVVIF